MTVQEIEALLEAKHQGARKDGLTNIARLIAMAETTDEGQRGLAERLTAEQVKSFITEWRRDADAEITRANQTFESGLRSKYDFAEKGQKNEPQAPQQKEGSTSGQLDAEAVNRMIAEAVKAATQGMSQEVANLRNASITANRKEQVSKLLGANLPEAFRQTVLSGFEGRSFESDESFNAYVEQTKASVAAFEKEMADKGLAGHSRPLFGKTNNDGVSSGVASYLEEKSKEASGEGLGGKKI